VRVGDAASGVLDASDAFLTTCVEGVLLPHRHPLWVPDAYMILTAARVDLARCAAIAADHGEDDALAAALDLLGGEFGAPVPDDPAVWHPGRPERSAARSHRVPMASLRADWAVVRRNLSRRESLTGFAAFLADRWNLEGVRRVPAEAGRRVIGRLRRRSR
jgi:hypothetical protein